MDVETKHFQRPDGALLSVTGLGVPVVPPEGAVEILPAVYETELALMETARETARATRRAAEAAVALTAYTALVAAGIPAAAAERLSGHRPD